MEPIYCFISFVAQFLSEFSQWAVQLSLNWHLPALIIKYQDYRVILSTCVSGRLCKHSALRGLMIIYNSICQINSNVQTSWGWARPSPATVVLSWSKVLICVDIWMVLIEHCTLFKKLCLPILVPVYWVLAVLIMIRFWVGGGLVY